MSTTARKTTKPEDSIKDATEQASAAMNDGVERMTQGMSKFGSFGQETMEAAMASASTMAKGFEKIAQENMNFAKSQMEVGTERVQSLTKVKSPQEFFEAQANMMREVMELQIEQTNKVSDMMISTAREAAQPLSKRYSAMVEMMQPR
jgi:phasin family protein